MSLISQAKLPDLASLMAQSYAGDGNLPSELSMLLRPQYDQMGKNADLASLNASIDMLGNLFSSSGKNNADINSLLFPQAGGKGGPSQADIANFLAAAGHQSMNPPPSSTQAYSSKSSTLSNPYYSQSAAALDKAQQDLIALYSSNPLPSAGIGGGGVGGGGSSGSGSKYPSIPDPLSKSTLAANNMFMNPIYAKLQQDALNAMIMKPPSKTSSKSESKSRDTSDSSRLMASRTSTPSPSSAKLSHSNFNVADLAVSSVNQSRSSSRSPHKKQAQFSISDLVSPPPPSKMMKLMESSLFGHHDPHGDDKAEILNLSGNSSDK